MKVLALDTALGACSVAYAEGDDAGNCVVRGEAYEARSRGHAEVLMPMIERVLDDAGVGYADLDRIGVTVGPGTFTGVRVGVAAARGLALATGLPVVTMTTLEAIACNVTGSERDVLNGGSIVTAVDARRGELYVQVFGNEVADMKPPQVLTAGQAASAVPDGAAVLIGTGATLLKNELGDRTQSVSVSAGGVQPVAAAFVGALLDREPLRVPPEPLYLRAPDAKLPERMGVGRRP